MSIGTGIFLGALVIATAILFAKTHGQWNWKRIIIWALVVLIGVPAIGAGVFYAYSDWQSRPRVQAQLWDIQPGDTEADVKFKKGNPSVSPDEKLDKFRWGYAVNSDGSTIAAIKEGTTASQLYLVSFSASHRVKSVICIFGDLPTLRSLNGIGPYSSLEEVEQTLGKPSYISRLNDDTERWYSFDNYHVAFAFSRGRMSQVGVYDPAQGPVRFASEAK